MRSVQVTVEVSTEGLFGGVLMLPVAGRDSGAGQPDLTDDAVGQCPVGLGLDDGDAGAQGVRADADKVGRLFVSGRKDGPPATKLGGAEGCDGLRTLSGAQPRCGAYSERRLGQPITGGESPWVEVETLGRELAKASNSDGTDGLGSVDGEL